MGRRALGALLLLVFKTNYRLKQGQKISLNAGQKNCRMHSAILSTFIKLPFVIKSFVLSIFEWLFYTGFTVPTYFLQYVLYRY